VLTGLCFSLQGFGDGKLRAEVVELPRGSANSQAPPQGDCPTHPYFVGVQFHPEFKSRHTRTSPPFLGLILAASGQLDSWLSTHMARKQSDLEDEESNFPWLSGE